MDLETITRLRVHIFSLLSLCRNPKPFPGFSDILKIQAVQGLPQGPLNMLRKF